MFCFRISVQLGDTILKRLPQVCVRNATRAECVLPSNHYRVANFTCHKYNRLTKQNDICVVRLKTRIAFNSMLCRWLTHINIPDRAQCVHIRRKRSVKYGCPSGETCLPVYVVLNAAHVTKSWTIPNDSF